MDQGIFYFWEKRLLIKDEDYIIWGCANPMVRLKRKIQSFSDRKTIKNYYDLTISADENKWVLYK